MLITIKRQIHVTDQQNHGFLALKSLSLLFDFIFQIELLEQ